MNKPNRKLPTIKELYSSDLQSKEKDSVFQLLVNQPPKKDWVKLHPFFRKVSYLPIERVEWLLTNIFINWHVEIKEVKILANSVITTLRLHYHNPISGEWQYQDGVGASPLQTDKDSGAIDFNNIKSDAVMKAAPASKSFAVKDAAEQIGRLFGRDLNRADQISYDSLDPQEYSIDPYGKQASYIGILLENSTLNSDEQVEIENDITSGIMTEERASELIEKLKDSQLDAVSDKGGVGNEKDINKAVSKRVERED